MATIEKSGKKYLVRYDVYTNGQRKQRKKTFDRSADAKAFKTQVESQALAGTLSDAGSMTVKDYLEMWYDTYTAKFSPNYRASIKNSIHKHIIPRIGGIKLRDLRTNHIQDMYNDILGTAYRPAKLNDAGTVLRSEMRYSPAHLENVHKALHRALEKAVDEGLIPRNYSNKTERPRVEDREIVMPPKEQMSQLIERLKSEHVFIPCLICSLTGCRRGETLGLKWSDVDYNGKTISIRRSYTVNNLAGTLEVRKTKTAESVRTIPISTALISELRVWRKQQLENAMKYRDIYQPSDYVCTDECGTLIKPKRVSATVRRASIALGMQPIRTHDLRHAYATYLIDDGASPKTVQALLGHKRVEFTLNRYVSVVEKSKKEAGEKIANIYDLSVKT